jgi:pimeloyl-ACP methyl ester carboxylesterase
MQRNFSSEEVALDSGLPMEQKTLSSFDGTPIVYRVRRAGPRWLVICNGYAGTFVAWRAVLPRLDPRLSILIWDYRGMYLSSTPKDKQHMTIEDDSKDLEGMMAAEDIDRAVLAGWSVGVQVALEHYRRRPDQVEALILHNGAPERVLHTSMDGKLAPFLLVPVVYMAQFLYPLMHAGRPLLRLKAAARLSYRLGIVRRNVWHIHEALKALTGLHLGIYSYMVLRADEHRTADMWSTVKVPTLITFGSEDLLTPEPLVRPVHEAIDGSELYCINEGSHYSLMEYPEVVSARIQQFLDDLDRSQKPGR